ncbi:MAG: phosphatidylinositol-specific phospholipase C domain-containing protein [Eubacterium sp.]|nr:phosphatidylinositol-specific phospholipase C domain-containing protein [Eubacterium sp.]
MTTDLRKWMSEINSEKKLFELNIPGTHDCVTQYVQLSHFARCQNLNIYEQLCIGVRALDIRVKPKDERLVMIHAFTKAYNSSGRFEKQMDFNDVLQHVYRFLDENPSETVIVQFKNDTGKNYEKSFDNLFYTYIKPEINRWYLENKTPTLGEARGKVVLIRRCLMDENNQEYTDENTGIDFSKWVEQTEVIPDALVLETGSKDNARFIIQDRYKYKAEPKWIECVKPFLDERKKFDGDFVICYLSTSGGYAGPKNNSFFVNDEFEKYELKSNNYYGTIYLDFPYRDITRKIIGSN